MIRSTHRLLAATLVAATLLLAACGSSGGSDDAKDSSSSDAAKPTTASTDVSGNVAVVGIWTGDEQKSYQAVLDAFQAKYPNVKVKYTAAGDNTPTVLSTAVALETLRDFAAMLHTELAVIDERTDPYDFADRLRWNQAYFRLARGL